MNIGLIGRNITHSYSKMIHHQLGCQNYKLYDILDIDDIIKLKLDAFNVTHPYKKDIFKYLTSLDPIAKQTQSVNTVIKINNSYIGYNTDYYGFESMIDHYKLDLNHKHIVIIGHGATSKTVAHYLKTKNIASLHHLVRHVTYDNDILLSRQDQLKDTQIIINTTPLGMFPHTSDEQVINFENFPHCQYAIDVIYNPYKTSFLLEAKANNIPSINGLYMLLMQAVKTQEIFTNKKIKPEIIDKTFKKLLQSTINIVLIGMPLSGKTAIGQALSHDLKMTLIDTDRLIEKKTQTSIASIFKKKGQIYFRHLENQTVQSLDIERGAIISTGGGVILNQDNMEHLKQNGVIVFINKDLSQTNYINNQLRPLVQNKNDLDQLFKERYPTYKKYADIDYLINQDKPHSIERLKSEIYEYFSC